MPRPASLPSLLKIAATFGVLTLIPVVLLAQPHGKPPEIENATDEAAKALVLRVVSELAGGPGKNHEAFIREVHAPGLIERNGIEMLSEIYDQACDLFGATPKPQLLSFEHDANPQWYLAVAQGGAGEAIELRLRIGGDPALIYGAREPQYAAPKLKKADELPALAAAFLDRQVAAGAFSGAVLVAKSGEPLFGQAYGLADRTTGRANTLDTPINLGSMNKMFTAIAIAQLRAVGKLDWDDKVGKFLPDYPNAKVREKVTIRQLLSHTSGLPSYWNPRFDAAKNTLHTVQDFFATFAQEPLLFEPGEGEEYSNGGPVVLGLILEKLSGQTYYEYVREHIYKPAGMSHTAHYPKDDPSIARGYLRPDPKAEWISNAEDLGRIGSPAGGGYSSASDLARFAKALGEGKLLAKKDLEVLWTPGANGFYGLLWGTGKIGSQRWVGHNGGAPGINADFRYFPESGYTVIVLANQDHAAMAVSEWLAKAIGNLP